MGKNFDTTNMSAHAIIDRKIRIELIENTVGWGHKIVTVPDNKNSGAFATLTSTGVMVITADDGFIITAWVANVRQAVAVWKRAKGNMPLPSWLWRMINYNNNTALWHKMAA